MLEMIMMMFKLT